MITETNESTVPSTIEEVVKKYGPKVKGMESSCGILIGEISDHAARRIVERGISLAVLEDAIVSVVARIHSEE